MSQHKYIRSLGVFLLTTGIALANTASSQQHSIVLGTEVQQKTREMQNQKEHFTHTDNQICAQVSLVPSTEDEITFTWTKNGTLHGTPFKTKVKKSPRFRTHSCITPRVPNEGSWSIVVTNSQNKEIASKTFNVASSASDLSQENKSIPTPAPKPAEATIEQKTDAQKEASKSVPAPSKDSKTSGNGVAEKADAVTSSDKPTENIPVVKADPAAEDTATDHSPAAHDPKEKSLEIHSAEKKQPEDQPKAFEVPSSAETSATPTAPSKDEASAIANASKVAMESDDAALQTSKPQKSTGHNG